MDNNINVSEVKNKLMREEGKLIESAIIDGKDAGTDSKIVTSIKAEDRADAKSGKELLQEQINNMTDEQLILYMEGHHKSDVYIMIRDFIGDKRKNAISKHPELGPRFKMINKQSKESWDHDHTLAKNIDVDRACTHVYKILLGMIKQLNDRITILEEQHLSQADTESVTAISEVSNNRKISNKRHKKDIDHE